jgi:hypothetical protein
VRCVAIRFGESAIIAFEGTGGTAAPRTRPPRGNKTHRKEFHHVQEAERLSDG